MAGLCINYRYTKKTLNNNYRRAIQFQETLKGRQDNGG